MEKMISYNNALNEAKKKLSVLNDSIVVEEKYNGAAVITSALEVDWNNSLAGILHSFYNLVGEKQGWLKQEYATPLSEQNVVNKKKNVEAVLDVVKYFMDNGFEQESLNECIETYLLGEQSELLDKVSDAQHEQWKSFVNKYQKEKITPEHEKYNKKNHEQFKKSYYELSEQEKDQDKLVVAVVADSILKQADSKYDSKLKQILQKQ